MHNNTAKNIAYEWITFFQLPDKTPDGKSIDVKTIGELIGIMKKFNPYWILEMYIYFPKSYSISRWYPNENYDYNIDEHQYKYIWEQLVFYLSN